MTKPPFTFRKDEVHILKDNKEYSQNIIEKNLKTEVVNLPYKEYLHSISFLILTMFPLFIVWIVRFGASQTDTFNTPDVAAISIVILAQSFIKLHYKSKEVVEAEMTEQQKELEEEKINMKYIGLLSFFGISIIIFCISYLMGLDAFKYIFEGRLETIHCSQWILLAWSAWCYFRVSINKPLTPSMIINAVTKCWPWRLPIMIGFIVIGLILKYVLS